MNLNEEFWDSRYKNKDTGWDIGYVSTPLKEYFDQITNKDLKILIPGGGNSYEAEYLHQLGFKNVFIVDLSKTALQNFKKRVPNFPIEHLILGNFFDLQEHYNLIIEQTFFCALDPNLRPNYVKKTHDLLAEKGKLIGLLFCIPLNEDHPPFGGNKEEYFDYFKPFFEIEIMKKSYNSIPARINNELFIKLIKK